jgi:hypothetical protein
MMKLVDKKRFLLNLFFLCFIVCGAFAQTFSKRVDLMQTADHCMSLVELDDTLYFPVNSVVNGTFNFWNLSLNKITLDGSTVIKGTPFGRIHNSARNGHINSFNGNEFTVSCTVGDTLNPPYNLARAGYYRFNRALDTLAFQSLSGGDNYFHAFNGIRNRKNKSSFLVLTDSSCGTMGTGNYKPSLIVTDSTNVLIRELYFNTCIPRASMAFDTTRDQGYIIGGTEIYFQLNTGKLFLIKTDSLGDVIWQNYYNNCSANKFGVETLKDGGYVVAASSDDSISQNMETWQHLFFFKIDENGNDVWQTKIGSLNKAATGTAIKEVNGGGSIVCGTHYIKELQSPNGTQLAGFLCRLDSAGKVLWFRNYRETNPGDVIGVNYLWDVITTSDGGFAATGVMVPTDGGTQDVWILKVDSNGMLGPGPANTASITSVADTVCVGQLLSMAASSGCTANDYEWSSNTGTVRFYPSDTAKNANASFPAAGTYTIYQIVNSTCGTGFTSKTIVVLPKPGVQLTLAFDTICKSAAVQNLTGGNPAGGVFSGNGVNGNTFDPASVQAGWRNIIYTYTDSLGCVNSDTDKVYVSNCTGIEEYGTATINIYPNPFNDEINISYELPLDASNCEISLIEPATGRVLFRNQLNKSSDIIRLNTVNLSAGIYIISIGASYLPAQYFKVINIK